MSLNQRFAAQLLDTRSATTPEEVVDHLLAVQGQDLNGARLALRARSHALSVADVDKALTKRRSLIVTWVNRGTLHLISSADYPLLHMLTTPQLRTSCTRRLNQEGVSPSDAERAAKIIVKTIDKHGPQSRAQLRDHINKAGIRTEGQALVHILFFATMKGLIVRGPVIGKDHCFVLVEDWLGKQKVLSRERALAQLSRRYLKSHAPADDRDLAQWAGITLGDARAGLKSIARELLERSDGLLQLKGQNLRTPKPITRWFGPYDPILHGWRSRDWILGNHRSVVTINGLFRPFAMSQGDPVGTWSLRDGRVAIDAFNKTFVETAALAKDKQDVVRFLVDQ